MPTATSSSSSKHHQHHNHHSASSGGGATGSGNSSSSSKEPQRKDTVALKCALANVLGERGPEYWQKFQEFLAGKVSRLDFDAFAGKVLGTKY
ncbi:hypothetical protein HK102_009563, partial [Quaeritorhiza haematococci]